MTDEQKKQVRDALILYACSFGTHEQAAESLDGISVSTIGQIKNNEWDLVSERLWFDLARQLGFFCREWQPAYTSAYILLRVLFADAQHYATNYSIAMTDGLGKTFASGHYVRENGNTFYLAGNEQYNRLEFITALLRTAGVEARGTMPEMIQGFAEQLNAKKGTLLIIDDADKLKDRVLHLLVLIFNSLAGSSGLVIMGGYNLRARIVEGARLKKTGFNEIYESIGRRFISLAQPAPRDVELVCRANGVTDDSVIGHIKEKCGNNLQTAAEMIRQHNGEVIMAA